MNGKLNQDHQTNYKQRTKSLENYFKRNMQKLIVFGITAVEGSRRNGQKKREGDSDCP